MKTKAAILNASPIMQNRTNEIIEKYNENHENKLVPTYYLSGRELLSDVASCGGYNLYIMDVVVPEYDGFAIAEKLRAAGDRGRIVYINGDQNRAWKAFRVSASDYLTRAETKDNLETAISRIIREIKEREAVPIVELKLKKGIMRVAVSEITYADKAGRSVRYHFIDGRSETGLSIRDNFGEAVKNLNQYDEFMTAGSSYIINLSNISILRRDSLTFKNGETILPPKSMFSRINAAWREYCENA